MTKGMQSPINLAFRLESLTQSLANLEAQPSAESENEARRLVTLLRASSEFRGMDSLLAAARTTEHASSGNFVSKLQDLITELQRAMELAPSHAGMILIVSSDNIYTDHLQEALKALKLKPLVAPSPFRAKELLAVSPVAFCLVDIALADLDGRAFIADLRTRPETAALPVIAITPGPSEAHGHPPFAVPGADIVFSKSTALEDIANYLTLRLKRSHMKGLQARRDQVTGLPNRAACHEIFHQLQRSVQANDPLAFVLVGIHQFSAKSAQCSSLDRDELIRKMGAILSSALRATDVVARWDASEFAILLTGEDHFGATKAIEKLLPNLSGLTLTTTSGEHLPITTCVGITINNSRTSIEEAALRAESHLFMAYSDCDAPAGGQQIVSDAAPISHREEPVALCLTNPGMAKVIKQILERETFRVEIFSNTDSVFQQTAQTPFSLLILDDELPGESGFTLLKQLNSQANTSTLGTMMMISRQSSIERVMKLGANDFFLKPPTMPEFLSQIRRVISHNSARNSNPAITIMIADHEFPQLMLAGTTLHQLGTCQILLTKGAADTLQRLKSSHPEYLILNPLMPHISLNVFLKQVGDMEWLKDTKIILATPAPTAPLPVSDRPLLGAISRPFRPVVLLEELHRLIPALPNTAKGRTPTDPRLLELEIQRILALSA